MKKVIEKSWNYSLYKGEDNYVLEVLCGGVGMYQVKILLNSREKKGFLKEGEVYIDKLAKAIQRNPSLYKNRDINNVG